jgi:hypothetical protein
MATLDSVTMIRVSRVFTGLSLPAFDRFGSHLGFLLLGPRALGNTKTDLTE